MSDLGNVSFRLVRDQIRRRIIDRVNLKYLADAPRFGDEEPACA